MLLQTTLALLALAIWIYLIAFHGQFWQTHHRLATADITPNTAHPPGITWPTIAIIIPARNEADLLPQTLTSLLQQDYPGSYHIYLIDDHSTDKTSANAQAIANQTNQTDRLTIRPAAPLPDHWTGKLWALNQGIEQANQTPGQTPDYYLLTDADIEHDRANLRQLVIKAETEQRDLVSLMVLLRCQSPWEQLLIPAFVFFFAKLYPFSWVNNPHKSTAAAAGGCSLIRRDALEAIGGIASLKNALIDDCTLAANIKHRPASPPRTHRHNIWLGLSDRTTSLRPYDTLSSIWQMVARTAYTQLNYSPWLLLGTLFGMYLIYLQAPIAIITNTIHKNIPLLAINLITYSLIITAYTPITKFYKIHWIYRFSLPLIGLLYTGMTIDSARRHWQGQGGSWKGRTY
jgi:hopene-associated glycosyltransferase HpnB